MEENGRIRNGPHAKSTTNGFAGVCHARYPMGEQHTMHCAPRIGDESGAVIGWHGARLW